MKNFSFLYLVILVTIFFFSCKKEQEVLPTDTSKNYYTNVEGAYIIYHVDSFFYNQFTNKIDTFKYDVKEKVVSFFDDAGGRKAQRIQRYLKVNNVWQLMRVWKAFVNTKQVEKTEEDITFIKLIFPLNKGSVWNGNAMNTLGKQNYTCTEFDYKFLVAAQTFDSCATILQLSDSTLIAKNESKEIYAKNIGLVYKRTTHLEDKTSQIDTSKPIAKRANTGTDVIQYCTEFGNE